VKNDGARLLSFYAGNKPDDRGRFLRAIRQWSDDELEQTHDYIQWLFPLAERSGFNAEAPILDAKTIREFRSRLELLGNVQTSFRRLLAFYGMENQEAGQLRVTRAVSFAERSKNWITPSNHNHLRITRMLKSLRLLGLEAEAAAFFDCLADIYRVESAKATPGISGETFAFWQAAAGG
jgi:Opioid growth factor receptor (OGFr) conserved region